MEEKTELKTTKNSLLSKSLILIAAIFVLMFLFVDFKGVDLKKIKTELGASPAIVKDTVQVIGRAYWDENPNLEGIETEYGRVFGECYFKKSEETLEKVDRLFAEQDSLADFSKLIEISSAKGLEDFKEEVHKFIDINKIIYSAPEDEVLVCDEIARSVELSESQINTLDNFFEGFSRGASRRDEEISLAGEGYLEASDAVFDFLIDNFGSFTFGEESFIEFNDPVLEEEFYKKFDKLVEAETEYYYVLEAVDQGVESTKDLF